jgi:hypothetical protein
MNSFAPVFGPEIAISLFVTKISGAFRVLSFMRLARLVKAGWRLE